MTHRTRTRNGRFVSALVSLATVTTLGVGAAVSTTPAQAATPRPDGKSSWTAAASCWEIKQNRPRSRSGVYWLVTPRLVAPQRFYCDMKTDGGGWVLIGRGRQNWSIQYEGAGSATQVRGPVSGRRAFAPRQLSSRTIDGLLDGRRVDALPDGVRVRRALNVRGTSWQEVRFKFAHRGRWAWSLGAGHRVTRWRFGHKRGTGTTTAYLGGGIGVNRLDTRSNPAQGWVRGMAYGRSVRGRSGPTSYLWSRRSRQGRAIPFAQMFIRPKLRLANLRFPVVPDTGTPARTLTPLARNGAKPNPWGVTGLANGRDTALTTEVSAFAQSGDTVYVGGNFRYVQAGPAASGPDKVQQRYLAAFDARSGEWIPDFRPVLNGQVKALAVLPDGRLVAGGEFTTANGVPSAGAVALDPRTGATDPSFRISLQNRLTGALLQVRALTVSGRWLYLGGAFTHVTGGPSGATVFARGAARVDVSDGTPDGGWNPDLDGTVVALDTDASGDRVYAAGYFATSNGLPANHAAELSAATARPNQSWQPSWSNATDYQQAIDAVDSRVWVGGAEHALFSWDTGSWSRTSGAISKKNGDFQAISQDGNVVYGGCHCDEWVYTDAYSYPDVGSSWSEADHIGFVGGFDKQTGKFIPDFDPVLKSRRGEGAWAVLTDATGTTWVGGDFTHAVKESGSLGWVGGFVRFAPRDTTAPTTPSAFEVASSTSTRTRLRWGRVSGASRYELIRGNRVVTSTTATYADVPAVTSPTRYFVRAVDAAGNRSASTPALILERGGGSTMAGGLLVDNGTTWRWRYAEASAPAGWNSVGFDDSTWKQGRAILGFGSTGLATDIDFTPDTTADRPMSAQFRRTFSVADPSAFTTVTLSVRSDDGVVVYVNGTEVGRSNLPDGTLTDSSFALTSPSTGTAATDLVTFAVPKQLLVPGKNVVAASVHLGYRATADISFDLKMEAE